MRTRICRTFVIVLWTAVAIVAARPGSLWATNCQECDASANCYSEPASDWCQCTSKLVGGELICLAKDPGCQSYGCGGPATLGPVRLRPIESQAFTGFEEREPLLAGLLIVATREDAAGHRFLAAAPIMKGTMAGARGSYRYHAAFFPRADDRLGFIVDLDGPDRSSLVFSGVITSGGLQVSYTKTSRTAPDARPESERVEWSAPQ